MQHFIEAKPIIVLSQKVLYNLPLQITVLAIIVTVIKIILFDTKNYPELFGKSPTDPPTTTTSSASMTTFNPL